LFQKHVSSSTFLGTVSKDDERKRVDKELANIRSKFAVSGSLKAYHKKKYIWKMCYIYMLGYDVDFGHVEAISLLAAQNYQEKAVGYMAISLLIRPGDQLISLVINSMRNDLFSPYNWAQTLSLSAISNIGGDDFAESLTPDVQRLLYDTIDRLGAGPTNPTIPFEVEQRNKLNVSKKCFLCLLRLFRTNPDRFDLTEDTTWLKYFKKILEERNIGLVTSAMSLLLGFTSTAPQLFSSLIPFVISVLNKLACLANIDESLYEYLYYKIPSPWCQVKCLRFLHYFSAEQALTNSLLVDALSEILSRNIVAESVNKSNTDHCVLFEAVNLIVTYGKDAEVGLRETTHNLLGNFLSVRDANIRYLGIDVLTLVAKLEGPKSIQMHQSIVLQSLRDPDVSIRKRALEVLYLCCDSANGVDVVNELVKALTDADSTMKEEMVVKIAILAEKFLNDDYAWYIDTMVTVIVLAGDYCAEAVWHRVVLIITNHSDTHEYAAEKMFTAIKSKWIHETAVGLIAYILAEVGLNICDRENMSGLDQFAALHNHFGNCSTKVQAILLTSYMKFYNLYPDTREYIEEVFKKFSQSVDMELQQRACEYLSLANCDKSVLEHVLETMPLFSSDKESSLLAHTEEKPTSDRSAIAVSKQGGGTALPSNNFVASPTTSVSQSYQEPAIDLLSLNDDLTNDGVHEIPSDLQDKVKSWLLAASIAGAGVKTVLYDDNHIKIQIQSDYRGHQGRLSLFFSSNQQHISNLSVTIPTYEHIIIKKIDPPANLPPDDETVSQLAVECLRPFVEEPNFTVSFTCGRSNFSYNLRLPISVAAFFEPLTLDKNTYMARWKSMEQDKQCESQEVYTSKLAITPELISAMRSKLYPKLRIGIANELDTATAITGCCTFRTGTKGPDGNLIVVGALVRLEGDPSQNRFRVTVRAKHPIIAQAIKTILMQHSA
jgi:AP-2 complex subunit alpha